MIVDPGSGEPLYVQVARVLQEQIISGMLPLGSLMPSEVQLRDQYGINRSVARQAYDLLESEGLCVTRRGLGRFVTTVPQTAVITLQPGDSVRARMPAEAERAGLGIGPGIPLLEIIRAGGQAEAYSAAAAAAVCRCPAAAADESLAPALG
jgi:DNA-binding transcriptional regulator YhcF (GntR family)